MIAAAGHNRLNAPRLFALIGLTRSMAIKELTQQSIQESFNDERIAKTRCCGRLWRVDDVIGWIINWVAVYRER